MREAIVPGRPRWVEADRKLVQWLRKQRELRDPRQLTVAHREQTESLTGYMY